MVKVFGVTSNNLQKMFELYRLVLYILFIRFQRKCTKLKKKKLRRRLIKVNERKSKQDAKGNFLLLLSFEIKERRKKEINIKCVYWP